MAKDFDLGWLVIITPDSRVNKLRISTAMSLRTFAAFEQAGDETSA